MSRFARSIHIAAPAPDVWKALVDVEAWPGWASQFKRIELIDHAPPPLPPSGISHRGTLLTR